MISWYAFLHGFAISQGGPFQAKASQKSPQEKTTAGFTICCPDLPGDSFAVLENNKIFTTRWFGHLPWYYSVAKIKKKIHNFKLYTWALKKDTKTSCLINLTITIPLGCCPWSLVASMKVSLESRNIPLLNTSSSCLENHPIQAIWKGSHNPILRGLTNHGYEPLTKWDDPPSGGDYY